MIDRLDHLVLTVAEADLCFVASVPPSVVPAHLAMLGIPIEAGPVARTGAIMSIYRRDPDRNLMGTSNYAPGA